MKTRAAIVSPSRSTSSERSLGRRLAASTAAPKSTAPTPVVRTATIGWEHAVVGALSQAARNIRHKATNFITPMSARGATMQAKAEFGELLRADRMSARRLLRDKNEP
ncbi:hypothetical protein [Sphingomonas phyllosphaerae]|uniref:hypothetical protein n=1 Tax=Sphingomonas phyllosphaerae TaxID=257003 RepID=UPI002413A1DC|nr:hypothetical protein [Sphingomonas phyllosphaerae]